MKHLKILNEFAKDKGKAIGVKISISDFRTSFIPLPNAWAKYEDVTMLSSVLTGAQHFIFWLERNGYKICKKSRKG